MSCRILSEYAVEATDVILNPASSFHELISAIRQRQQRTPPLFYT